MDDPQQKQQQTNDVDQAQINSGQTQQNAPAQNVTRAAPNPQPSQQAPAQQEDLPAGRQEKKEDTPAAPPSALSPAEPVSAPSKEGGPAVPVSTEKLAVPSLEKLEVAPELKEIGVEAKDEVPELTPEDAQAGIVHAKEATPVVISDQPSIKLPMSQQQAQQTVKVHKKVKDSIFWFAMLILRQWQIAEKKKGDKI